MSDAIAALFSLSGKTALVTGAAVGMGTASAKILHKAGAFVFLADEPARRERLEQLTVELGAGAEHLALDPTSEVSIASAFRKIQSSRGRLDILVNGAVVNHNRPFLEISTEEWDQVQAVNLRSAFLTTKAAVPLMREAGGGRIINISTVGGRHPVLHGNAAYSAARAGLNMLTLNCALDFAVDGVTANAILPGAIRTETVDPSAVRSGPGMDPKRHLSGPGGPDDVAGLVLLLAGPAGRYINGQQIAVDGGFLVS